MLIGGECFHCFGTGRAVGLTIDHKPNLPRERQRIERQGGKVIFHGCWRVCRDGSPSAMACSRSLGDMPLKKPTEVPRIVMGRVRRVQSWAS